MRTLGVAVMIGVLAVTTAMVAAPAGAGTSSAFCDSLESVYGRPNSTDTEDGGPGDLEELADGVRSAANEAPKKVKKGMKKMAKYYDLLAGGAEIDNPSDASIQKIVAGFFAAQGPVRQYVAEECPDLDLVPTDIPELG